MFACTTSTDDVSVFLLFVVGFWLLSSMQRLHLDRPCSRQYFGAVNPIRWFASVYTFVRRAAARDFNRRTALVAQHRIDHLALSRP
jgi:hypothetical protein